MKPLLLGLTGPLTCCVTGRMTGRMTGCVTGCVTDCLIGCLIGCLGALGAGPAAAQATVASTGAVTVVAAKPATKLATKPAHLKVRPRPVKPAAVNTVKPAAAEKQPALPMRLSPDVQPLAYSLALTVDPTQPQHSGTVEINLLLRQPIARNHPIRLHAKDLQLQQAWLEVGARRLPAQVRPLDAESIALRFAQALPAGPVRLGIAFTGSLQDKDVYGLFRQQDGGQWYAITQFESQGARLAFPLFDEPGWKVPWALALTVPDTLTAVSNMPVAGQAPARPGWKTVRFEPTPPLPSYLLAFAVGNFDVRDAGSTGTGDARSATPLRFITPQGRAAEADFAAGITGPIVERLEAYFGMPHPYPKLDSLVIPVTVNFGAMENAGLISYESKLLLARPDEVTPQFQRDYVSTAAHELAHQWFGNLVTMAWWDDLWLNESFASWLGDRITAEVKPGWGWETSAQVARARAMRADRLVSARRIQQPVNTQDDMGNLWDAITYEKGQAVLGMAEQWLGADRFQAGVRRYIGRHAWGHATSSDFFAALGAEDPGLPDTVRSFTGQPGIPRVAATLLCDGGPPRLALAQSRLLPLGSPGVGGPPQRWQIPLLLRTPAGPIRFLLTEPEATLALPDATCPAWVQANVGGLGYYRVVYSASGMQQLAKAPGLSPGEAMALLDDAQGLHDAGDIDNAQALALVSAFAGHARREVAESAISLLLHLRPLVDATPSTTSATDSARDAATNAPTDAATNAATTAATTAPTNAPTNAASGAASAARYAQLWQKAFGDRARALGWRPRSQDSDDDRLLRLRLLPLVADLGDDSALRAQALALAQAWLADPAAPPDVLPAAQRPAVLATAALAGDAPLFDAMLARLRSQPDRNLRADLLTALGSFRQPDLAQRALQLLLDPQIDIRESRDRLLGGRAHHSALLDDALAFVSAHHADLVQRLGRDEPAGLPYHFNTACSADQGGRIEAAFAPHAARFQGGQLALKRTLESVQLCGTWRARQGGL